MIQRANSQQEDAAVTKSGPVLYHVPDAQVLNFPAHSHTAQRGKAMGERPGQQNVGVLSFVTSPPRWCRWPDVCKDMMGLKPCSSMQVAGQPMDKLSSCSTCTQVNWLHETLLRACCSTKVLIKNKENLSINSMHAVFPYTTSCP